MRKKVQIISAIVLSAAVFVSIDLGINFTSSLVPELNDGLGSRSILQALFGIFGETGWTKANFLFAFEKSLWFTFAVFTQNIAVWIIGNKTTEYI